jgi:hypothetical protein
MTKAEILAVIKTRTGRTDLTDIDSELLAVLIDMTARHAFLKSSEEQSWVDGTASYDFPDNANKILDITEKLTSASAGDTTRVSKISFRDYLNRNIGANDEGEPQYYAVYNKKIYVYPTPNDTYTGTVYYQYLHPSDLDNILLDDEFKECVVEGTCFKIMEGLGIGATEGAIHYQNYENQLSVLARNARDEEIDTVRGYY